MAGPGPTTETAIGGLLATSPVWGPLLHDINLIAGTVATVGGAAMAVHGVARIIVGLVERSRARDRCPPE